MRIAHLLVMLVLMVAAGCGQEGNAPAPAAQEQAPVPRDHSAEQADALLTPVDDARLAHHTRVVAAEAALEAEIDLFIRQRAAGGDPEAVQEAMAERDRFVQTGALPFAAELEGSVAAYEQQVAQAEAELAQTLRVAVEALTHELRIDEALALQAEAARLEDSATAVLDTTQSPPTHLAEGGSAFVRPDDGGLDFELFEGLGTPGGREPTEGAPDAGTGETPGDGADPPAEPARPDPIAEQLAVDEAAYTEAIDAARQTLMDRMDTRIAALRTADEMSAAARIADEQVLFREHGMLPTHPSLQPVVRRYVIEAGRALRRFTRPCSEAVTAYYTTSEVARGQALEQRLNRLRTTQAYLEAVADTRATRLPQSVYRFDTGGEVTRIAVSGDGLLFCAWSRTGEMHVWSLATGVVVSRFDAPLPDVGWMHMDQHGEIISASSWSHSGMLYRRDGSVITDLDEHRERYNMEVSEDGRYVVIGGHYWTTLQAVEGFVSGAAPKVVNDNTSSYSIAISSNAGVAVSGGWDPAVKVYDLDTHQHTRTLVCTGQVYGLGFAHNGSHLYAATTEKRLLIWETESFEQVQAISGLPDVPRWSSLSNDGTLICANLSRGWVFETATGRKLYEVGEADGYHLITPNGAYVLGTDGNQVVLYRLPGHE